MTRSRHAGSRVATGDVMIFLDSHCEGLVDWIRPLLQRIKENRKAVVTPVIDLLEQDTLKYHAGNIIDFEVTLGAFYGVFSVYVVYSCRLELFELMYLP